MNQHKNSDLSMQEETADIELSGEELLSLATGSGAAELQAAALPFHADALPVQGSALPAQASALPAQSAALPAQAAALPEQAVSEPISRSDAPVAAARRPNRAIWRWRAALACAGAVSLMAIGAVYRDGAPRRAAVPPPPPAIEQPAVADASEASAQPNLEPVWVRNPFDKSEVFEFPAGTTEQQANDAVADMLLQRAMERQAQYDASHSKRRRSS